MTLCNPYLPHVIASIRKLTVFKLRKNSPTAVIPDAIFLQIFNLDRKISDPGSRAYNLLRSNLNILRKEILPFLRNELFSWIPGYEKSKLRLAFLIPGMTPFCLLSVAYGLMSPNLIAVDMGPRNDEFCEG